MSEGKKSLSLSQVESLKELNSRECVHCTYPWIRLAEKDVAGSYVFCAWMDRSLGVIEKNSAHKILSVWNSQEAISIRKGLVDGNGMGCMHGCIHKNSSLDTFLGYEKEEYEIFTEAFLNNLMDTVFAVNNRLTEIPNKPIALTLFPSTVCNLRCRMCKMDKERQGDVNDRYFDGVKPLLPFLHELSVFGGEPFACKTTRSIIFSEEIKRHNQLHISTVTNGTLLSDDVIERLTSLRLGRIIFSVDGATSDVYNKIRIGADFDKVYANIKKFVECRDVGKLRVKIVGSNFVIQALNYHQIADFIDLCHSLGIRAGFNLVGGSTELYSCAEEVERHIRKGIKRAKELRIDYTLERLDDVMKNLPEYMRRIRNMAIIDGIFGEKKVRAVSQLFAKHKNAKRIIKRLMRI